MKDLRTPDRRIFRRAAFAQCQEQLQLGHVSAHRTQDADRLFAIRKSAFQAAVEIIEPACRNRLRNTVKGEERAVGHHGLDILHRYCRPFTGVQRQLGNLVAGLKPVAAQIGDQKGLGIAIDSDAMFAQSRINDAGEVATFVPVTGNGRTFA